MNIFKRNRYAHDSETMMFYTLLAAVFFLPFSNAAATFALFLGWGFYLLRSHYAGWKWKRTVFDIPLAIFVIMGFLSIINSPQKMFSFYNYYHLVGKYLLIYYLAVQSITDEKQLKKVFAVLGASAVIVILYGFIQYFAGINTTGMDWTDRNAFPEMTMRIFSTWENPNLLAGYLNIIIALLFGMLISIENKKYRMAIGTFLIMAAVCLCLTYARGACFSIAIVIALYGLFYNRKIILPFAILTAAFLYFDTAFLNRLMFSFTGMDTSSELRLALWESTIEMILDHPLLGIGWGAYYFVYPIYDFYMQGNFIKIVHAHNMYLNIAAEIGIVGFAGFMTCVIGSLWHSLKSFKYMPSSFLRGSMLGCGLAAAAIMLNGFTDYVLFNTSLSMLFWLIIALEAVLLKNEPLHSAKKQLRDQHAGIISLPELSEEEIRKNKSFNINW